MSDLRQLVIDVLVGVEQNDIDNAVDQWLRRHSSYCDTK